MIVLFNKPFRVLSQFTGETGGETGKATLKDFIDIPDVYPAGRLDFDSEGLLILTDDGRLQERLSHPRFRKPKEYWVQVEGCPTDRELDPLRKGIALKDGLTRPAEISMIDEPDLWPRHPPIRFRRNKPTTWLRLVISEGRHRQVRRMTAHIGFPALRLVRYRIDRWSVEGIGVGEYIAVNNESTR